MYHLQQGILSNEYNNNPFLFVFGILVSDRLRIHVRHHRQVELLTIVVMVQNVVELEILTVGNA